MPPSSTTLFNISWNAPPKTFQEQLLRHPMFIRHENPLPRHSTNIATAFCSRKQSQVRISRTALPLVTVGCDVLKAKKKIKQEESDPCGRCKTFSSSPGVTGKAPTGFRQGGTRAAHLSSLMTLPGTDGNTPSSPAAAQLAARATATARSLTGTIFAKAAAGNL